MVKKTPKRTNKQYVITIIEDRCKGCSLCVTFCPSDTLKVSDEPNQKGVFVPMVVDISTCKGCNLCSKYCPDFAIFCSDETGSKNKKKGKVRSK
jgi:2-oxoglutarate ferredoxin oxidoreductase subunit delta